MSAHNIEDSANAEEINATNNDVVEPTQSDNDEINVVICSEEDMKNNVWDIEICEDVYGPPIPDWSDEIVIIDPLNYDLDQDVEFAECAYGPPIECDDIVPLDLVVETEDDTTNKDVEQDSSKRTTVRE